VSLAQRFERRLEGLVGGAFARVFKGQVEPAEIGTALQREATDRRNVMGNGEVLCPNRYRVTLASSDYERLAPWEVQLTTSLAELVQEFLDENQWSTVGDIEVYLQRDDELHTGVFGVASRMQSDAPPRRRPYDSLSLPVPNGAPAQQSPLDYAPAPYRPPQRPFPPAGSPAPYAGRSAANPSAANPSAANPSAAGNNAAGPTVAVPRPSSGALLVVDSPQQRFPLRRGSNVVGRGSDADVQLLDQGVSRRHLDIQYDGRHATLYDLGSTNGTTVNGNPVQQWQLTDGDVIRVGHSSLVFRTQG
jgi:predicted component of type VI protein secretion system